MYVLSDFNFDIGECRAALELGGIANRSQTGPSDSSLTSPNVAMQHLTSPARPVKRSYAEIADSEDEDPDSDELYGWAEEDELAAEGLVINESAIVGESVRK